MKSLNKTSQPKGFALIVTISIMVLLALLTVGLMSLSATALRSSGQSKARSVAQANARMAMMIALGEIQTALGPDQRVTARSEVLAEEPAYPLLTGVFKTRRSGLPSDPAGYFEQLRRQSVGDAVWLASSTSPITDPSKQSAEQMNGGDLAVMQSAFDASGNATFVEVGKIPVADTEGNETGTYAWWADDESQKAKLNVTSPEKLAGGAAFKEHWKLAPAQQANFFRVDEDPSVAGYGPSVIDNYDPEDRQKIRKLVSLPQADIPYRVGTGDDWFRRNHTDFTTWSEGLPVDVLEGRLKQDLSAYLQTGSGLADDDPVIRGSSSDNEYNGPALSNLDYGSKDMPRFGLIKSWKEIGESVTDFDTGGTESVARSETEHGIHPVILRAGIYYSPYVDSRVRSEKVPVPGGTQKDAFYVSWKLAAFPRITIWNPTSVPITDSWLLYEVGVTNHFMLVLSGDQNDVRSGGAARDDNNVEYWRAFNDARRMSFYNMMNANRNSHVIPSGGSGEATMPLHTYSLRLDSPLLPGETRSFYPESSTPQLLKTVGNGRVNGFDGITESRASTLNVMSSTPAPNNYFRVTNPNGREFEGKIYAKRTSGNVPATTRPAPPEFLESYLYVRMAESGPGFKGSHTHGCAYRLFKANSSGRPTLLQEIFSAEHTNSTNGFPTYSISNAREYDDPDDGVAANGFTLVKFYEDPNRELSARRGHQLYISYALEDPESDFASIYKDEAKQFQGFTHYNPLSSHIFPGSYEEVKTGVGNGSQGFQSSIQGVRQELYSEGRPEGSWLNDWSVDSVRSSEDGYGAGSGFGSPGLYDLNLASNGLVYTLYDFPRQDDGVLSLGELQAVNFASYPWQPGNAFGNSFADPRIPRDQLTNPINLGEDHPYIKSLDLGTNRYVDLSWLLNFSIWDRFFVSTIDYDNPDQTKSGDNLRNSRHQLTPREDQGVNEPLVEANSSALDEAASSIRIDGPFNVNTTSVAAWKQFLSANFNRPVEVKNSASGIESTPADQASFPRLLYPYRSEPAVGSRDVGSSDDATRAAFSANRSLSDEEVQKLAEKIVEEVRSRGPFLSVSDFVNRRLVADSDNSYGEWAGLSGTLQTAIDRVTVEDDMINEHLLVDSDLVFDSSSVPAYLEQAHVTGRPDGVEQSRLAGAPGSLSQADILRSVGPMLTARGDTFRIRAYGESRDHTSGETNAEAWCEAVVQRVTTPVDADDNLIAPDEENYRFGRKFKVVSFRWLNKNEL